MVIIRDDLVARSKGSLPTYLNYEIQTKNDSLYNTPPTFGIYVVKLFTDWLANTIGGLEEMQKINVEKSNLLYDAIDTTEGFYRLHAKEDSRSLMNVSFRLPNEELEKTFLQEAAKQNLVNLKGHRSVGGIRASIYNAMPVAGVQSLREFMIAFSAQHHA